MNRVLDRHGTDDGYTGLQLVYYLLGRTSKSNNGLSDMERTVRHYVLYKDLRPRLCLKLPKFLIIIIPYCGYFPSLFFVQPVSFFDFGFSEGSFRTTLRDLIYDITYRLHRTNTVLNYPETKVPNILLI